MMQQDKLVVNGVHLDLDDNIPVPISFAIADVIDPENRKRSYTKEFELPDTAVNRSFFYGAYSLHITDDGINFNSSQRSSGYYEKKGVRIFPNAVVQLKRVKLTGQHGLGKYRFVIQLISEVADTLLLLQGVNVNEFDWSAYDHTLTQANIIASWSASAGTGYYYPLIERGEIRPSNNTWRTTDLVPYVYLREVFIKCLEYAGIEYDSTFIDSTRFENVLFGYGGGEINTITSGDLNQRVVDVNSGDYTDDQDRFPQNDGVVQVFGGATDYNVRSSFISRVLNTINFTYTENQDLLNQFNSSELTIQRTGNYNLTITGALDWAYTVGGMTWLSSYPPTFKVRRNGIVVATDFTPTQAQNDTTSYSIDVNLYLQAGDLITFEVDAADCLATVNAGNQKENISLSVSTSTDILIDLNCIDTEITDGGTVSLAQYIPPMEASQLFVGVIRQFNLYMLDPDVNGDQIIEPVNDFYNQTNQGEDITQLIDWNKDFYISPSAESFAKTIKWMFKKNKDHDAQAYLEKWDQEYGDYTYVQSCYYAKGELKFQLPWSTIVPYEDVNGLIYPRFIKFDANNNIRPNKGEPRIMMRNGLKTGAWTLQNATAPLSPSAQTDYPSVHHFDDWEDPDFDLNFWLVNEVYYTASIVTNVNSYSEYYFTFIQEMTNPAGKIAKGYIKWGASDVKNVDYRDLFLIDGSLWKLNKFGDFDEDFQDSCPIEWTKVLDAKNPIARKITLNNSSTAPNSNARAQKSGKITVSANYDLDPLIDEVVIIDTAGITVSLGNADPSYYDGSNFTFINKSGGDIDIDADPFTINGSAIVTLSDGDGMQLLCDDGEFLIK